MAQGKIIIKSDEQIELIRISSTLACEAIAESVKFIKPGATGKQIDKIAEEFIKDKVKAIEFINNFILIF